MSEQRLPNPPTLVESGPLRFLIMDAPSDTNLPLYIKEMEKNGVTDVVRVCDPTYNKETLKKNNIEVHDWGFTDGEAPPSNVVNDWLDLVYSKMGKKAEGEKKCIAVHCVAGLGRAPVLVAIALIENGMTPEDSVTFIRERRRGAINNKQLKYLQTYKRRGKKGGCVIC